MNVEIAYKPGMNDCSKLWKTLLIFASLLIAVVTNAPLATAASCEYSSGSWANSALSQGQASTFRLSYEGTPSASSVNAIAGLSSGPAQQYANLAVGARFNPNGTIDVRNGSGFTAAASVAYQAGVSYHFILDVNVASHSYNAYVLLGSGQMTLGSNLAFRTEQSSVSVLDTMSAMSSAGAVNICNIAVSSSPTVGGSSSPLVSSVNGLNFGQTGLANSAVQTVILTNTGSSSVTISGVSVSGAGFTATGSASGLVVGPRQFTSVRATFTPFTTGNLAGRLTITSNAKNSPLSIALSGTGVASAAHSVTLSWNSSSSSVAGYNVYASPSSAGPYTLLNSSPVPSTSYVDTNVLAGDAYYFRITSVSASNQESAPSASVQAVVP